MIRDDDAGDGRDGGDKDGPVVDAEIHGGEDDLVPKASGDSN